MIGSCGMSYRATTSASPMAAEALAVISVDRAPLTAGTVVAERFVVEGPIGSGGMAAVFRAHDRSTGSPVALKVLHGFPGAREAERFAREGRLLAELDHPGIVSYVAQGRTPADVPFLAMQWLEGEDLSARLARGTLGLDEAMVLVRTVAQALAAAHRAGVVHRDIKPSNVFLRGGAVEGATLIDFGIARRALRSAPLTRTGAVLGTPEYMAPEQARGVREVGAEADVFALGAVLYECLAGRPPFSGDHLVAVLAKILFEELPDVRAARPGVPSSMAALLDRMLAKDPRARPRDASALIAELPAPGAWTDEAGSGPPTPSALADEERCLVTVVVATPRAAARDLAATLEPAELEESVAARGAMERVFARFGVRAEWLADGSAVATMVDLASATDRVVHAARCALALRGDGAAIEVALATGRGVTPRRAPRWPRGAPVGEAIDRAIRLVHSGDTSPGGVHVDEVSARLLDARFTLAAGDAGELLVGERAGADDTRVLLGKPTPCVGRDQELTTLEAALTTCTEESVARAVLVSGPPGMGKSRLRRELLRRIEARPRGSVRPEILFGRAELASAGSPYVLLASALRRLADIVDGEPLEAQRAKLRARLGRALPPAEAARVTDFLGEACGVPCPDDPSPPLRAARQAPRLMADHVRQAFADFLRAECAAGPVLVVLEDLHWGDMPTVKVLDFALQELPDRPWMVLALGRPDVSETFPRLFGERLQEIRLQGISKRAGERLVLDVLGERTPRETVARVVEQADGNPLFLEEIIRAVAEGCGDVVPHTVMAMLEARLSRLDAEARRILRAASVFGGTFWAGGVVELAGPADAEAVLAHLRALVDAELVAPRRASRLAGEAELGFRHALVREAAYSLLTDEDRVRCHGAAGAWLHRRGERDPMVIADHLRRGGAPEAAVPHYIAAADQAMAGNDLAGALVRAGLGVAAGAGGEALGILRGLECGAHFWLNEWSRGLPAGSEALDLLPAGGLRWCKTIAHLFIFTSIGARDERRFGELVARFAVAPPAVEARPAFVEAAAWLVTMFSILGAREPARGFLGAMSGVVQGLPGADPIVEAWRAQGEMFHARMLEADPWRTLALARASSAAFRAADDRRNLAFIQGYCGMALADLGLYAEAEAELRDGRAVAARLRESLVVTNSKLYLALLLSRVAGREAEAEALALDIGPDNPLAFGVARAIAASVALSRGDLARAEQGALAAMEMLAPMPPLRLQPMATLLRARAGSPGVAALAGEGTAAADALGGGYNEIELRVAAAEALHRSGDARGARRALDTALDRIAARAEGIADLEARAAYLGLVPENARARAFASAWGGAA